MKHRISTLRVPRGAAVALAVTALAAGAGLALPSAALADGGVGSITYYQGSSNMPHRVMKTYSSCNDLISDISKYSTGNNITRTVVWVNMDWNSNTRIDIPAGANVTINLQGHMINRGLANTSFDGEIGGEVIIVRKGATLTIEGGDKNTKHYGTLSNDSTFWHSELGGKTALEGGLITGGASSGYTAAGGGITLLGENAKLYLNDVTVAGNVADTTEGSNGQGGGVRVHGNGSTLELSGSNIDYNHAEADGGAIYMNGNDSSIVLKNNSELRGNTAEDYGGGLYHNGKRGSVTIKEKSEVNSNVAGMSGGGIYDYYNYTSYTLDDARIAFNTAKGKYSFLDNENGKGGGIFLNDDSDVKMTNGTKIWYNSANKGGGIFADDDGIELSLSGGSAIQNNTATTSGGGVFLNDSVTLLLDNSKISNNKASSGAGVMEYYNAVFGKATMRIDLKNKSQICDNSASNRGGAVCLDSDSKINTSTVESSDGTGTITGNSAERGGALFAGEVLRVKNLSIQYNYSTESGALHAGGSFKFAGKNIVENNYRNGNPANVYISYASYLNSYDGSLSWDSSIGVSFSSDSDDEEKFVYGDENLSKLVLSYYSPLHTDDPSTSLWTNGKDIRRSTSPTKFKLSVYGASSTAKGNLVGYGTKVELKSSDYAKDGCRLTSWSVAGPNGTDKIVPTDGVASFNMPACEVTARANYTNALQSVKVNVSESATWDELGSDASKAEVSSLTLTDANGASYGVTASDEVRKAIRVGGSEAKSNEDGTRSVTYAIELDAAVLENYGLYFDVNSFKGAGVESRASFGTASCDKAAVTDSESGKINIIATVNFAAPSSTVTVNASSVNGDKTGAGTFDSVVSAADGTVTVTAPSEPGWEFTGWKIDSSLDGVTYDNASGTVTLDSSVAGSDTKLEALYKPVLSAVSIEVAKPEPGKAFPSQVKSVKVAGAVELDVTDELKDLIKVSWTLADGLPAGDTVQGNTRYKVKLTANTKDFSYVFGMDESVRTTVNGLEPPSVEYDSGTNTGSIVYYVQTAVDDSFSRVIDNAPIVTVERPSQFLDELPTAVYYITNSGSVKSASVTWDESSLTQTDSSFELWSVSGSFKDEAGETHEVSQDLRIGSKTAEVENVSVSLDKSSWIWTKGGCKPKVTVTADGKTLTEGTDYEVAYWNSDKVGVAMLAVTGKGDYAGIESKSFRYLISPADVTSVKAKSTAKHKVKVSWAKHKAQTDGFQVRYATSKAALAKGKGKTVKVKGAAKVSRVLKGLKSGKKVYVQVRAYKVVGSDTYYSNWSKVKAAKVK